MESRVQEVLSELKKLGSKANRDGMARYAIPSDKAFGVPMAAIQALAKRVGRNHELALALWATEWYEARTIAAFLDEPDRVTPAQMDRWCRDFDSWAICDTICFKLFDQTPHAYTKVEQWSRYKGEFARRGAFALLASLALHDKKAADESFTECLPLIQDAASDDRNFIKKGVSWALRAIGRRNPKLNAAAVDLARHLAASTEPSERWIGKDALKELTSDAVLRQVRPRA